ncbi:MAG: AAA family ATPase [Pseudomonadota bacterium]|nr:AAA family ATPase [Pseudomonadota bacterium]
MIVVCEQCNSRLKLDEKRLTPSIKSFSVQCPSCRHIFTMVLPDQVQEIAPIVDRTESQSRNRDGFTIVITNQKGGVAKTSTCLNLGLSLALLEKKVLLIDFDVQANLTISMGYQNTTSFYNILHGNQQELDSALIQTSYPGLWLLPSNKNMVLLSKKYFGKNDYEYILNERLSLVKERFDYIIIDTPPSIEFLTINALTTSDLAIIPTQCDYLSTHGVDQVLNIINLIRKKTNPAIKARVLVTMYDEAATASRMIFSKLKTLHPMRMYQTVISQDERLREAQIMSMPVINYDQKSRSALQYMELAREIISFPPKDQ